jgi:cyclomaltodextrinase
MNDFIFGSLATDELRRGRVFELRQGVTHNHARSPRDPQPGFPIFLELTAGPKFHGDRAWLYWTADGSDPRGRRGRADNGHSVALELVETIWDTELWGYINRFRGVIPPLEAGQVVRYRLSLDTEDQGEIFADGGQYFGFFVDNDPTPDWARDAVIYQIFVDRFYPGEGKEWKKSQNLGGFFGGKLAGITQRMEYIANLGCNCLWLSPIFPSPSHHGYDATDLYEVEPRLGNKDDLKNLLDAAHSRGIRVLLDFVPNHVSDQHPAFQAAIRDPQSPYCSWFTFEDYPDTYKTFFGVKSLPQLNLRHSAARQYVLEAARYWLEQGVDGFRVDYALGPSPDFWADFRQVTRAAKADCWTFGEVVDPPDVQITYEGLLDGCLDFMLLEAMRQTFAFGEWNAIRFLGFLDAHESYYPAGFSRPSFLDNHDMNRFLWAVKGDKHRLKLAALLQFTLSGAPVIYYGTEVGLSQERDVRQGEQGLPEEARLPMVWDSNQDMDLFNFYRQLILTRGLYACLRYGERVNIASSSQVLVYERRYRSERLVVALNIGMRPRTIVLPYTSLRPIMSTEENMDVENLEDTSRLTLPGLGGAVLKVER